MSNEQLVDGCEYLRKMANILNIHQISYGCAPFPPNKQEFWYRIGLFNAEMRILNIFRHIPPLTLHKSLMKNQNEDGTGPCIIKGYMWQEYCDQTGLGETLSHDGLLKLKRQVVLAAKYQFVKQARKPSRYWPGIINPPALCTNDDYLRKPKMVKILKEKQQFNIRDDSTKTAPNFKDTEPTRSKSSSDVQVGASATPDERRADDQRRPRPTTWYGQNFSVNFQPLGPRRKVIVPVIDDEEFEKAVVQLDNAEDESKKEVKYNEGNSYIPSKDKNREELLREIRKLKADKTHALSEQTRREEYLKTRISKLQDMLDKEESESKHYEKEAAIAKKELQQQKLDVEALKLEKELREQKIPRLETQLANQVSSGKMLQDQVKLLTDQYKFIKQIHDEKSTYMELLTAELAKKDKSKKKK